LSSTSRIVIGRCGVLACAAGDALPFACGADAPPPSCGSVPRVNESAISRVPAPASSVEASTPLLQLDDLPRRSQRHHAEAGGCAERVESAHRCPAVGLIVGNRTRSSAWPASSSTVTSMSPSVGAGRARMLEHGADHGDRLVAVDVDVERRVERRDAEARRLAGVDRLDLRDRLVDETGERSASPRSSESVPDIARSAVTNASIVCNAASRLRRMCTSDLSSTAGIRSRERATRPPPSGWGLIALRSFVRESRE
jgi:hypothetical protein